MVCRVVIFILFSALGFSRVYSQPSTFLKMYSSGNSGYAVREVNGNSFVVAGGTDYYYNFHWMIMSPALSTNIHFLKTGNNGDLIWEKIYSNPGYRTISKWMEPVQDGGFIITGSESKDVFWPPDSNDIVLLKANSSGIIEWAKRFDSGKDELGFCVKQTYDGGYLVSGFHDAMPMSLAGTTYAILIKTNASGLLEWEKKYQLAVRDFDTGEAFPCVAKQTADSGYVIVGTTSGSHQADVFVIRTDTGGNVVWAKSYEHNSSSFRLSTGLDIIETSSGDFMIAGSMDKDRLLMQFNYPYVLRISSNGVPLDFWLYESNPSTMFQSGFSSVQQTPDGGFFFTGMGGYGGFGDQAQLLKTDAGLSTQWSRSYTWDGTATMGSRSGRMTTDGGCIFTGKRQFDGSVLMKTDASGLIPCKNPGVLVSSLPSIIVQSRTPSVVTGLSSSPVLFTTSSPMIDTSSLCPVQSFALPVDLIYFAAEAAPGGNSVEVKWTTASELKNDYFVVEKSVDSKQFQEAGRVKGSGTTSTGQDYFLIDEEPFLTGVSYYRLRQVDFDGKSNYSKVVPVSCKRHRFELLNISGSYGQEEVTIFIASDMDEEIEYSLTDVSGREVLKGSHEARKGVTTIILNMKLLSHGLYFFTSSNGDALVRKKMFY